VKTSRMRAVAIDPERRVARVEAGAWWIDVSAPASELGLAPLAGSSPDVGVVGYTLGGGVSWLVRKHGLGANNVVAIELVTPDGRHVRADPEHEPELFWALRGGGGSFGVVTAIELRLFELPEVYAGVMFWPVERAAEVLEAWRAWTKTAPDEATSIGRILNVPDMPGVPEFARGRSFVTVEMAYAGDVADGAELIAPLRELGPELDMFGPMPPVGLSKLHMDPEGAVPAAMSDAMLLSDELDDAAIDALVGIAGAGTHSPLVMVELRHVGGAAGRSGADHGVLDRLPAEYLAFAVGIPMAEELGALIEAHLGRVRDALSAFDTQRAYLNFAERPSGDPAAFFGAEAYARLVAVREQADPARVMLANHPVG
jgi:FAD/FMN-containing dehydrogenase